MRHPASSSLASSSLSAPAAAHAGGLGRVRPRAGEGGSRKTPRGGVGRDADRAATRKGQMKGTP
ncbi:hypothetical protein ISF6_3295 [Piscinibacter sakaiensis]|uniref:Uncharacterized protein n=1 Tax=Piscinibacter sakaiensis TaxID=1547922 RepID=A0A0K8P5F6_PISS1|nr:hypothetical protein ISF6_3295 [Piscinibacter sakaiensis]